VSLSIAGSARGEDGTPWTPIADNCQPTIVSSDAGGVVTSVKKYAFARGWAAGMLDARVPNSKH
jgi:hypothetical protein